MGRLRSDFLVNNEAIFNIFISAGSVAFWLSTNICFIQNEREFEKSAALKVT